LIDVTDNTNRHSLITLASIFGLSARLDLRGKSVTDAVARLAEVQAQFPEADLGALEDYDQLERFVEHVDLFKVPFEPTVVEDSTLQWHKTPDQAFVLLLPNRERVSVHKDLLNRWNVDGVVRGHKLRARELTSEKDALKYAESMIEKYGRAFLILLRRASISDNVAADDGSRAMLAPQFGVIAAEPHPALQKTPKIDDRGSLARQDFRSNRSFRRAEGES
jgi:hypothetical protein